MDQARANEIQDFYEDTLEEEATSNRWNVDMDLLYFSSIDNATKKWIETLQHMWSLWKKCDIVSKTLTDYFETAPNPYLNTLKILANILKLRHIKSTELALDVIEEFSNWLEDRKEVYQDFLVPDLKIAAFKLTNNQKNLVKKVAVVYDFMEHKDMFLQLIQGMILEQKYKEAAQYAVLLQLQNSFKDPEILLIPLILQNKLAVMDEFLVGCPDIQEALISYLDNLIAPGKNMQFMLEHFIQKNNIPDVKISTSHIRPMTKLITRLIKQHNLAPDLCPHLNAKRSEGAIQFLIHKRYIEGSLSIDSWREMVREAVGNDPTLQANLLSMLVNVNDEKEGLYWAREFKIPKNQWPWHIVHAEEQEDQDGENISEGASASSEKSWLSEDHVNYYVLTLPRDRIKVIDNRRLFEEFLDNGLKGINMVGIDSEWKPSFVTKQSELALIQLATNENVYILDVITLNELHDLWSELGLTLFGNQDIIKIGFGIAHDMTVIRKNLPALSSIKTHGQGYLDLMHLWDKLVDDCNFVFPYQGDPKFTGKSLTLDAYCLLEIYNLLAECSLDMSIPFQDICNEIRHIPQKSQKTNTNKSTYKKPAHLNLATDNRGNENYPMNTGAVPKYDGMTNHGSIPKHGFSQNNQHRHDNRKKYDKQKKYNYNKHDSYNKYDNYNKPDSYNGNNNHSKYENHNRYNNYNKNDNCNKRENQNKQTHSQNRYDNQSRYDDQSRYDNQNKRDNHNRYDNQDRRDIQNRQDTRNRQDLQSKKNTRSRQDIQGKQDFQNKRDIPIRQIGVLQCSKPQSAKMYRDPIAAHTWRVVCDTMLGGLSSRLRMCGVDCVHVLFDEGGNESANLAMVEHRFLLTRHRNYQKFEVYVPLEKCYRVLENTPEKQLCEVLRHFDVVVTQNDIFSRCQKCNNDEFVKIPKYIMDKLIQSFVKNAKKNHYRMVPLEQMHQFNDTSKTIHQNIFSIEDDTSSDDFELDANIVDYFPNSEHRKWRLSTNFDSIDIAMCTTKNQIRIQIDKVPIKILRSKQVFYVCEHCGKIYWDGSHLERALNGVLKDIIVEWVC
ncbi:Probable exonuclease mut-7-like protein [Harpegnathos saltator]|uniref:Probable exonuclease mut-7-like protein n=1 Tax=Harpegnathos saltator TaxID=610380 RepID=E2C001_HARSA|nr:Probable exonuclease mut-7-like protein [Harpegnathos saltator]